MYEALSGFETFCWCYMAIQGVSIVGCLLFSFSKDGEKTDAAFICPSFDFSKRIPDKSSFLLPY